MRRSQNRKKYSLLTIETKTSSQEVTMIDYSHKQNKCVLIKIKQQKIALVGQREWTYCPFCLSSVLKHD